MNTLSIKATVTCVSFHFKIVIKKEMNDEHQAGYKELTFYDSIIMTG